MHCYADIAAKNTVKAEARAEVYRKQTNLRFAQRYDGPGCIFPTSPTVKLCPRKKSSFSKRLPSQVGDAPLKGIPQKVLQEGLLPGRP
jgi:hypothetical protein